MKVLMTDEMREVDERARKEVGIPVEVLMENAGKAVAETILHRLKEERKGRKVAVFAGKGNNGGDGLCASRWIKMLGGEARVILTAEEEDFSGPARQNLSWVHAHGIPVYTYAHWQKACEGVSGIVDAILGVGIRGEVRGLALSAIRTVCHLHEQGCLVVSVDIPSGLNADTGRPMLEAVRADVTVTMGFLKPGLILYPGATYCGDVVVAPLGYPDSLTENIHRYFITREWAQMALPKRKPWVHKGECGKVLLVCGSTGLTGAGELASRAAIRTGAGLAVIAFPESLHPVFARRLVEVMKLPLPECEKGHIGLKAWEPLKEQERWADALVIGPGVGRHPETQTLIRRIVLNAQKPFILDADGLFAFRSGEGLKGKGEGIKALKRVGVKFVLTPHAGELSRLLGVPPDILEKERLEWTKKASQESGGVVVFKGARTTIGTPDGKVFINSSGNAGMASGGVGDVLSGMVGTLLAEGLGAEVAATLAVFLHGLAGDRAAARKTPRSLIASDLLLEIPRVLFNLERES